jgi:hypothetical protein
VSFAAITLCVASEREIPKASLHFVIDSVRKLTNTPSHSDNSPRWCEEKQDEVYIEFLKTETVTSGHPAGQKQLTEVYEGVFKSFRTEA